jgi:hypothetical protein
MDSKALNIDKCPYFFYVGYEQFETTINNIAYTEPGK